jgi:hypothetical protein
MNIDTTDPKFITALAKACALTPTPSLIAQALREVIDAEREACEAKLEAIRVEFFRSHRQTHDQRTFDAMQGVIRCRDAIRQRGGK